MITLTSSLLDAWWPRRTNTEYQPGAFQQRKPTCVVDSMASSLAAMRRGKPSVITLATIYHTFTVGLATLQGSSLVGSG